MKRKSPVIRFRASAGFKARFKRVARLKKTNVSILARQIVGEYVATQLQAHDSQT